MMPCSWETNHKSGVTLAMHQQTLVVLLRAQDLQEGDEHPPMLSCGALSTLCLPFTLHVFINVSQKQRPSTAFTVL